MELAILSVIVQVVLIVHVLRTGRDFRWIFLLLFLPGIGSLIYLFMEVIPSLRGSFAARRATRKIANIVDPHRGLRRQTLEYEQNQSVDTATRLANELVKDGRYDEAITVCDEARSGIFEDDPTILQTLANAYFCSGRYSETIKALELLKEKNPDFRSPDGHLLYARALEREGATDRALEEYEALAGYFPGVEARVRLAHLHNQLGNVEAAKTIFQQIVRDARLAPKHFQKTQKEWIDIAKRESD